ncbi:hypothetical protein PR048_011824 [Dryococelus australis]|uniref:Integrase catalytic domain-containing protein n=1 Tax=Dryococelus australis TaxID=614101 RepID=A0ABQ9HMR5_9NEOP|nr:hypothetical protein PR048_011824 [Dryococelus australis]
MNAHSTGRITRWALKMLEYTFNIKQNSVKSHAHEDSLKGILYGMRWAVPSGMAYEVAQFLLENVICRHSTPGSILSDRGQVFSSAVVHELLKLMGVQETMTSGYRS